jgi:hypothetical protein
VALSLRSRRRSISSGRTGRSPAPRGTGREAVPPPGQHHGLRRRSGASDQHRAV